MVWSSVDYWQPTRKNWRTESTLKAPEKNTLSLLSLNSMRESKTHWPPGRESNDFLNKYFLGKCMAHHGGNVFGFSGSPSDATSTGRSYGSQITRNWFWGNPRPNYLQDRGPRDPKWVPWDQKKCLKNFLMPSPYDAILCVFVVCFTKNWENQQKQANFAVLLLNGQKYQKWLVFDDFFHFL